MAAGSPGRGVETRLLPGCLGDLSPVSATSALSRLPQPHLGYDSHILATMAVLADSRKVPAR